MKNRITRTLSLALASVMLLGTMASAAEYVVVSGDNLTKIANMYGTTWQVLAEINELANPNLIYPNQIIVLPSDTAEEEAEVVPEVVPEELPAELPPEEEAGEEEISGPVGMVQYDITAEEANAMEAELVDAVGYQAEVGGYPIVDTNQTVFFSDTEVLEVAPEPGEAFYGQDANFVNNAPSYTDNGDGTISDNVTGLMWTQDPGEKVTWIEGIALLEEMNASNYLGYSDWRLPTIKELYSLVDFSGNTQDVAYMDTDYFVFSYGDTSIGERAIDSQMLTSTIYGGTTLGDNTTHFGFNFADGRIKGYSIGMKYYAYFVRGNTAYGQNLFVDNEDGTITDQATSLMWMTYDSGYLEAGELADGTMNWEEALAWAEEMNAIEYLGYDDWRVPDAKELQSIVDYERSPTVTDSPAIDPLFYCTPIVNLFGEDDYGFYWTSTTHAEGGRATNGVYVVFGDAMGVENGVTVDAHGSGSQRSDPKTGDREDYPASDPMAPQGDEVRVFNMVRLVRDWDADEET